jgi:hypothetical protein
MPFLGERHQSWVNDMKRIRIRRLPFREKLTAFLFTLLLVVMGFVEYSSHWTQSIVLPRHSWLYLNTVTENVPATDDRNWSDEKSSLDSYWIQAEITLSEEIDFDILQVSLAESYRVFWDGYLIGTHDHHADAEVTQLHLLEQHHVLVGSHHVMLHIKHPRNNLLDLSKKQLILGKEMQVRMIAVVELFLLIVALGLTGIIVLLFVKDISSLNTYPKTTLWILGALPIYLGLSLVDTLHHQPFHWSNPSLPAIATACSLQLLFTLSRYRSSLLFQSFFSISAITYLIIYFILGNPQERLILYDVALLLTYFFFLYTSATKRISLLWCLVPLIPFLGTLGSFSFLFLSIPMLALIGYQIFDLKPTEVTPENESTTTPKQLINYLLVNSKSDKKSISLDSVTLIKAANNYSIIMLNSGETFLHDKSLLKLSDELPENFKRIHKSFLVNFDQIEQVKNKSGGGKLLYMKNGEAVPVGRVYQKELTARFA